MLTATYPIFVYLGLAYVAPWVVVSILLAILVLRIAVAWNETTAIELRLLAFGIVLGLGVLTAADELAAVKAYPLMVNLGLAALFAYSLIRPPTAIERIARLTEPSLDARGVAYTRRVTVMWLCFFILNGAVSWITAVHGTIEQWALYNGVIAYLLIGVLFAGEYLVRLRVRNANS